MNQFSHGVCPLGMSKCYPTIIWSSDWRLWLTTHMHWLNKFIKRWCQQWEKTALACVNAFCFSLQVKHLVKQFTARRRQIYEASWHKITIKVARLSMISGYNADKWISGMPRLMLLLPCIFSLLASAPFSSARLPPRAETLIRQPSCH